jgi:putative phosphoesterase
VFEVFRGADRILHAGDINSRRVLDQLAEIAPVDAVAGNADLFRHGLPLTSLIEVEGRRIGLVHGHGGWSRYLRSKVRDQFGYDEEHYLKIVQRSFGPVDAIVFGHTHRFCQAGDQAFCCSTQAPSRRTFTIPLDRRWGCCTSPRTLLWPKSRKFSHRLETGLALT